MRYGSLAIALLVSYGIPALCLAQGERFVEGAVQAAMRATGARAAVTIDRETTHILGPLCEDGYIDYVEALNEQYSRGVTPENNAAVPFWRAIGPGPVPREARPAFFGRLGIEPPAEEGKYVVWLNDFANHQLERGGFPEGEGKTDEERNEILWSDLLRATEAPWSEVDLPLLADWLEANGGAMDLIREASRQPRFFSPLMPGDQSPRLVNSVSPGHQELRAAGQMFAARAMFRLKQGKVSESRQDVLTAHRLARLLGQGPTLVDALVAIGIETRAWYGDLAIAAHSDLTAGQVREFVSELRALPPLPNLAERFDRYERYIYLDSMASVARDGPDALGRNVDPRPGVQLSQLVKLAEDPIGAAMEAPARRALIDWDDAMRMGNDIYDRLAQVPSRSTYQARMAGFQELEAELKVRDELHHPVSAITRKILAGQRMGEIVAEWIGEVTLLVCLSPLGAAQEARDRAEVQAHMAEIALALASYRAENGAYPENLAAVTPQPLGELPEDVFADGPFQYQRKESGYLLRSVGRNRRDDGGAAEIRYPPERPRESEAGERPAGDDIVIEMP